MDNITIARRIIAETSKRSCSDVNDENFFPITQKKCRASFIDGSSYDVLSAPAEDFSLVRIAVERFDGRDKMSESLSDFLVIKRDGTIEAIGRDGEMELHMNSLDACRSFFEWKAAEEESADGMTVVMDGYLENPFFDVSDTLKKCSTTGICGIAKKSRTDMRNMKDRAAQIGLKTWAYKLGDDHYACRLNEHSNMIFEVETSNTDSISNLAYFSCDPFLPGYPFGLIDAHRRAKIEGREVKELRAMLYAMGSDYVELHDFLEA
jgi:hypothetical protein